LNSPIEARLFFGPIGADFSIDLDRDSVSEQVKEGPLHGGFGHGATLLGYMTWSLDYELVVNRGDYVNIGWQYGVELDHGIFEQIGTRTADHIFGEHIESRPRVVFLCQEQSAQNGACTIILRRVSFAAAVTVPAA
jgi:hypothetical protein